MTTTLAILAWLLSGFAATYVGRRFVDGAETDASTGTVISLTLGGGFTVFFA